MAPVKSRLVPFLLLASTAGAQGVPQGGEPVQMAPLTVTAAPLGFIGIRCSASVGLFGLVSDNAPINELVIVEVIRDSAAQRAGLLAHDRILRIDGIPIAEYSVNSLRRIGEKEKGDTIGLEIGSPDAKASRTVKITLGARKVPPK